MTSFHVPSTTKFNNETIEERVTTPLPFLSYFKEVGAHMTGYIHSIETFGTVDGPGIRFVVFFQGCPLRCLYCHNPDTWETGVGNTMTVDEILKRYDSCKEFLRNGGITATGGEPLLQMPFLIELFRAAKQRGIHTCLDTSGITYREVLEPDFLALIEVTDLVLLDIKQIDTIAHEMLTGHRNEPILNFAQFLAIHNVPTWIRHVVVPDRTTDPIQLEALGYFLGRLKNIKALDVLPYHAMGNEKYQALGMTPPLLEVPEATKAQAITAKETILKGIRKRLSEEKNKH